MICLAMPFDRDLLPWPPNPDIRAILSAGSIITASPDTSDSGRSTNLPDVLLSRLERFDTILAEPASKQDARTRSGDLSSLKVSTAFASFFVLRCVDDALKQQEASGGEQEPLLGTRDLAQLRTHLALVFAYGVNELLQRILPIFPKKPSKARIPPGAQVIDLTAAHEDLSQLSELLVLLLRMCRNEPTSEERGKEMSTSFVMKIMVARELSSLVRACICMGWLPNDLRGDLSAAVDGIMKDVMWLLTT